MSRLQTLAREPLRAPLRYVQRRVRDGRRYLRGRRILREYSAYYREATHAFAAAGGSTELAVASVREVGVRDLHPDATGDMIQLPPSYPHLVDRIARDADRRFGETSACRFFPTQPPGPLPERSQDVPALARGEIITMQLLNPFDLDGVAELSASIMEELERKIYGAYAIVDKLYVYRSPVSRQTTRSSWIWHYDNHPHEVLKLMIYLTNVTADTAPFEYLRGRNGRPVYGSPLAPTYGNSRIPEARIATHLRRGCESRFVTGPRGTIVLFDENVIHRGTLALAAPRDVVVFQVRPVPFAARPYIDPRWTGSFQHVDFNRNPRDLAPRLKH